MVLVALKPQNSNAIGLEDGIPGLGYVVNNPMVIVGKSPKDRVVGPLANGPNGLNCPECLTLTVSLFQCV